MLNDADRQFIRDTIYEVIEPFVIQMSKDYEESRKWMARVDQGLDALGRRVMALEQEVASLSKRVSTLSGEVSSLERRIGRLEGEVSEVKRNQMLLEQRLAERGFVESEAIAREKWAAFSDFRALELRVTQLEVAVFHERRKIPEMAGAVAGANA